MEQLDTGDKIDIIVTVCGRLAADLKDPTAGGSHKDQSAEWRKEVRDYSHDDLIKCIDTLAAAAHFHHGFFDILDIAQRLHINVYEESSKPSTI